MKTFLLAALICLLANATPVSAAELDTPFALRIGESTTIGNTGVVVGNAARTPADALSMSMAKGRYGS